MVDALLDIPEIKQMYLRRLRSLMDELLQPLGTPYADRNFDGHVARTANRPAGVPAGINISTQKLSVLFASGLMA